jgi:hypothetical protein
LQCFECAQSIQDYLISQGIRGKRIQLYTGDSVGRDSYIYDDSVGGEAISANGYHVGIAVERGGQEIVFDNHHPDGVLREQWMGNLVFPGRLFYGQYFQVTEVEF